MSLPTLTDRQRNALAVLAEYVTEHGYPPSVRAFAERLECAPNTAYMVLLALQRKGYISRVPGQPRALRIIEPEEAS